MSQLAFGVIGCGRMGARRAATITAESAASLIAVADVAEAKAYKIAATYNCLPFCTSGELLGLQEIDTVFVCTPNISHAPVAIQAMRSGKHVICEKPLARTPTEAEEMVREAQLRGVTLKVGANLRYFATVQQARELASSGEIGELLFLRASIGNNGWSREGWYANATSSGGGCVLDNGCHVFDLVRWFLGDANSCTGQVMNLHWDLEVEDNGMAIFTTSAGRLASVHCSWTEWNGYFMAEIYGSTGLIQVRNDPPMAETTTLILRSGARHEFDFGSTVPDPYMLELRAYLSARRDGEVPKPDGMDGLRAVEMATAVYASSRLGRRITVRA